MNHVAIDILKHYGTPRHSGRYPWGSGEEPYQRSGDFLSRYETLISEGNTESEVAEYMGFLDPKTGIPQTSNLRAQVSLAKAER